MKIKESEIRDLHIRIPKEKWLFLKSLSAMQEESMTVIVCRCIDKMISARDKKLKDMN